MNLLNSLKNAIMSSIHDSPLDSDNFQIIDTFARFDGTKTQLERRFLHFSADYASTSNNSDNNEERSFVWREIDAAFKDRILTVR